MAKGKAPAFLFYPGDWLSSTSIALMTPAEEGAYIRLLCHEWNDPDCSLPSDDESLAALSRLGASWAKSGPKIMRNFQLIEGRYVNLRLAEERQKHNEWRTKSSEGGKLSAAKRATNVQPPTQPNGNQTSRVVDECLPDDSNHSSTRGRARIESEIRSENALPSNGEISQRFLEWIGPYPRVANPDHAHRTWLSCVSVSQEQAAFDARDRYLASRDVAEDVVMEAHNFIAAQYRCGWSGKWPAAKAAKATRYSVTPQQPIAATVEAEIEAMQDLVASPYETEEVKEIYRARLKDMGARKLIQ